jgi:S1-C subfamily serine protease
MRLSRLQKILIPAFFTACLPLKCLALDYVETSRSTYRIYALTTEGSIGTGSGVQIGANRILTNCHVVANAKEVVAEHSATGKRLPASGISTDQGRDACVLEVIGAPGKSVPQARFVSNGDNVHVLGYPQSSRLVVSEGTVLETDFKFNNDTAIHTSNYCAPGASGGPLLNDAGELVGLIFAGNSRTKTCFAVPAYYLQRVQAGSIAPFSTNAPIRSKGSVYHDKWRD